ncbi:MAG: rod shape-determining protein RodA [Elusimicrobia bacterium]|nr:rod shape-determining protein RodA [Elusimicrobiota bacterium]
MVFQRANLKKSRMDWALLAAIVAVLIIGTIAISSSVFFMPHQSKIIKTQIMAIPIGFTVLFAIWSLNYQVFQDQWKLVYTIMLLALIGVLFFGVVERGARSWYRLPLFSVQPSEFARIGVILALANYLDKRFGRIKELSTVLGAIVLVFPVFFLLIKQPDFSAVLVTLPIILIMLFCAGADVFHLSVILGYSLITALFPIAWTIVDLNPELRNSAAMNMFFRFSEFGINTAIFVAAVSGTAYFLWVLSRKLYAKISGVYFAGAALVIILGFLSGIMVKSQMKEYQQKRLEVFLSPDADPKGAGYNLIQAKVAMGSGGFFGKGIFSGTQSRLGFVPERHTDFILAVIGEEMGFWGTMIVMVLYIFIMRRLIFIAHIARDRFGYLTICGIFGMFMIYFLVNFGMLLGLSPVAGVPLPLLSYGGSNLVATLTAVGVAQSVYARRYALA